MRSRVEPRCGRAAFIAIGLVSTLLAPPAIHAQAQRLATAELSIGGHALLAELADTEALRSYGLMNRRYLPPDHGMLFVFQTPGRPCFWMKNTPLPLSIAFISPSGHIVNIEDMSPNTLDAHCAAGRIRYALEMNQGWFAQHGIRAGARVDGLPGIP
ncbi:MAG: DUF192 domain-containing protein [Castellaniella sp.]